MAFDWEDQAEFVKAESKAQPVMRFSMYAT